MTYIESVNTWMVLLKNTNIIWNPLKPFLSDFRVVVLIVPLNILYWRTKSVKYNICLYNNWQNLRIHLEMFELWLIYCQSHQSYIKISTLFALFMPLSINRQLATIAQLIVSTYSVILNKETRSNGKVAVLEGLPWLSLISVEFHDQGRF